MRDLRSDGGQWTFSLVAALALAIAAPRAHATFTVNAPWVRVASGARAAEAYMELQSTDGATLVGVTSDVVARVTIRPPGKDLATLKELPLPAGTPMHLAPGGYRLSLVKIAYSLKLGDYVPLVLIVRNADGTLQEVPINAEVRRHSAIDDHLHGHAH